MGAPALQRKVGEAGLRKRFVSAGCCASGAWTGGSSRVHYGVSGAPEAPASGRADPCPAWLVPSSDELVDNVKLAWDVLRPSELTQYIQVWKDVISRQEVEVAADS